jgi:hypothetical protein
MWGCSGNPLGLKPGATSIFQGMADPTPSEAVDMALDRHDADRRYQGVLLLAKHRFAGEKIYLDLFVERARDTDPGVRAAATRALGFHGRPEHAELIIERLRDEDPVVRLEAARALQRIHAPRAIDPLLASLDPGVESDTAVRANCARALGQYPTPRVLERLIGALSDQSLAVNWATLESLRTLTGQDFGYDRAAWQRWYNTSNDYFAARRAYTYPTFARRKRWFEYLPFVPPPPTDPPALPAGMSPDLSNSGASMRPTGAS